jgi:hypothetical protein
MMPNFNLSNLGALRSMQPGGMPGGVSGTPAYPTFNPAGVRPPVLGVNGTPASPTFNPAGAGAAPGGVAPISPQPIRPLSPVGFNPQPGMPGTPQPSPIGPGQPTWNQPGGGNFGGQMPQFNPQQMQNLLAMRQMYQGN